MLTLLVPCVSSSTTAMRWSGRRLTVLAGGKAKGDEGQAQGRETANRWGEHLRLQLIYSRTKEAAYWREILNSRETRHQKGAAAQEA